MSLTDDARRLHQFAHDMRCEGFGCLWTSHALSCPMRAVPRILAVLEAAEKLRPMLETWPAGCDIYGIWTEWSEKTRPQVEALVAALEGTP